MRTAAGEQPPCPELAVGWRYDGPTQTPVEATWPCGMPKGHDGPHLAEINYRASVDHSRTKGWWMVMPPRMVRKRRQRWSATQTL